MPALLRDAHPFKVRIASEDYARLHHHAVRLALDKCSIVQIATYEYLNSLDEKEAFSRNHREAGKKKGIAKVGGLPGGAEPVGMNYVSRSKPEAPATAETDLKPKVDEVTVIKKLKDSFRNYAEFVEAAEGSIERSIRVATVFDSMKERAPIAQAEVAFIAFQELIKIRDLVRKKPIESAPDGVKIEGDVDED